ncbi:MAG: ArsR family transcriptional regulator, arsenate/arsenite/antimonite-responsive transcriptional [Mycobacterium sp.]|jgi:ArsR family transcriptional regulator|uniref:ArsR/SmtB family transcription factor n=1 Tax=Mycobacterium sp. TaxID=1785 RepID=UPI0028B4A5BB|nr:metalloregulator ArsR/SmtB family transcription factor [Mycobacterium sp.]MDT5119285.1 ArsR family transcriptional regulator, arsenate/arsenite/antimonite-responsive transcriptional [Mycobacterium sp.]
MRELTSPFGRGPMPIGEAQRLASVLKALADPSRLQLLALLSAGELTSADLLVRLDRLSQPTVSHHLGILRAAGLITSYRIGVFTWHALSPAGLTAVARALNPGGA